ncbi:MAG: aldo/keto reductase, partial [Nodosilinea sp.]
RMGNALRDGYRDRVFLMTKADGRTKASAAQQIDESLKRLQTDHIDLLQFHEVIRLEDPDRIFAEEGAVAAFRDAKQAGKIRYVGFTGHKDPLVHLRMLEIARQHDFQFDTVQMPLNVMDAHFRSFQHYVLPVLIERGMGVLGMKSMAGGYILKSRVVSAVECLHYALNLPTSVVITGIDSMEILDQAIQAAESFNPMSDEEVANLLSRTTAVADSGQYEPFKTDNVFDATAMNPEWLGASAA